MNIKYLHLVKIVKRGSFDNRAAQLDRLEIGDRGDCSSPADLIVDAEKLCKSLFGLELICYCPSWELGCVSKF